MVENTRQAYQAGFAFGSFQDLISDMNPDDIVETIPGFHHTRNRFNRLMEVAAQDPQERLSTCLPELDFIKAREQDVDRLLDLQAGGVLPTRITHNDTKINNVMLDGKKGVAQKIVYDAFATVEAKTGKPALEAFQQALVMDVGTGVMDEYAGLHIAVGVLSLIHI